MDNYGADEDIEGSGERRESDHHWVDEVVRCETRGGALICNDFNPINMTMRPHPEIKDSSMLTRYWCFLYVEWRRSVSLKANKVENFPLFVKLIVYVYSKHHFSSSNCTVCQSHFLQLLVVSNCDEVTYFLFPCLWVTFLLDFAKILFKHYSGKLCF